MALRLGLRYVKGLREEAAKALVEQRRMRPFTSIDDLARRVPELRKNELVALAEIGALNSMGHGASAIGQKANPPQRHRDTEGVEDFRAMAVAANAESALPSAAELGFKQQSVVSYQQSVKPIPPQSHRDTEIFKSERRSQKSEVEESSAVSH